MTLRLKSLSMTFFAIAAAVLGPAAQVGKAQYYASPSLAAPPPRPNNRAERSLRDVGVVARKVSCGNKTEAGKAAWEVLVSLAATCRQRGCDFVSWLAACLPLAAPTLPVPNPGR